MPPLCSGQEQRASFPQFLEHQPVSRASSGEGWKAAFGGGCPEGMTGPGLDAVPTVACGCHPHEQQDSHSQCSAEETVYTSYIANALMLEAALVM